jgi:hypothetical protein
MGKFRIGAGLRITKKNAWWASFVLLLVGMAYIGWWVVVGACWGLYGIFKLYSLIFKGIVIGCKKIYASIERKKSRPDAEKA